MNQKNNHLVLLDTSVSIPLTKYTLVWHLITTVPLHPLCSRLNSDRGFSLQKRMPCSVLVARMSLILIMACLIIAGSVTPAQAQGGGPVTWSFVPVSSAMPPNLPDGEIVALGGQRTLIVAASQTDRTVHVVNGSQSTRLFAPGDPAPGGGIFIGASDGPNVFYVVSANLVFFSAEINVLGTPETRFFRWENGILTKLLKPTNVSYDFGRNDSAGNFLAARQIAEGSIEYWITDGVSKSTPITLHSTSSTSNAQGVERIESNYFYVKGITADGSFLISETHDITEYRFANGLGTSDSIRNLQTYFMGSRNNVLASSTSTG
jgi:hypothetical protein